MSEKVYVVGVGMTDFVNPYTAVDYPEIGEAAVVEALADSGISYDAVQQAVCGFIYGDSSCGQRVLYNVGMTGIPIHNVNNHGATGATALYIAHQLVQGGLSDVILAVGFEKMSPGTLPGTSYPDRKYPLDKHITKMLDMVQATEAPVAAQCFGNAAIEHMKKYGTTELQFAKIAAKNHENGSRNPRALKRKTYTVSEILNSKRIFGPLTKLQCCANSNGAAAAVLMSEKAVAYYGLQRKAVEILGMAMATDTKAIFAEKSLMKIAGYDMTAIAAKLVYEKTGVSPQQIDVVELHDCFSSNELITYESLQLCDEGKGGEFVDAGDNTYGGKVVVNPSGGLIAKGNPIGATGIAQCAELVWQLRGKRGVDRSGFYSFIVLNGKGLIGLQHNLGLGGAVVVSIYRKGFTNTAPDRIINATDNPENINVYKYLKILEEAMQSNGADLIEEARGVYGIVVRNGARELEGRWVVNMNEDRGKITFKSGEKADVAFRVTDEVIVDLLSGKLNPLKAFLDGKIKIQGNIGLELNPQRLVAGRTDSVRSKI